MTAKISIKNISFLSVTLYCLIYCLSGCSLFIDNFEKDILEKNKIKPIPTITQTTCSKTPNRSLISKSESAQKEYTLFLNRIETKENIKFIDEVILWSLIQMNQRPDLSSPTAKLQLLISIKGKEEYINSYSNSAKDNIVDSPYLYALDTLIKKYRGKHSLLYLATLIDKYHSHKFRVSKKFSKFLKENKSSLSQNLFFKKSFFRGEETLQESETIPALSFRKIISRYLITRKSKSYQLKKFLFKFKTDYIVTPRCNFDMDLYKGSIFLINEKKITGNIFGISKGKSSFLAVSGQEMTSRLQNIESTFLLKGISNSRSAAVCSFRNKLTSSKRLWLISTSSRDPGQHLYHLLQYGIYKIKDASELGTIMKFSRHLFLKDPVRLIIESRRSSEKQLNELLKLNLPIYNAKSIGTIWGHYQSKKNSTFLLDEREEGYIKCLPK